jgi:hypothetical protein
MAIRFDTRAVRGSEERSAGWGLAAALVLLALLVVVVDARRQPPAPKPSSTPPSEFSAARARDILRDLAGDGTPHPVGSPAHAAVRDRVIATLRRFGYEPAVEKGFSCSFKVGACGPVENVVARLQGSQPTGAVLLMAHYDSVPAGPGAGDDLSGVASVLETARLFKAGPPPKNDVLFLLNDGEEVQLIGAHWFVDHSPLVREVKAVINLEARGTSGPSLLFETVGDNNWTVPLYAERAPHPLTSSVFVTIYELMGNDTDLSAFKKPKDPVPGINFAFVGDPTHYHSAADTFDNVSPASLQHHGDNAVAALRGLSQADLIHRVRGRRVFFDVLGAFVAGWPMGWSLWLALLALALVLAAVFVAVRRQRALTGAGAGVGLGLAAFLLSLVLSVALAFCLSTLVRSLPTLWIAHPFPLVAAFWLLPLAVTGFVARWLGRQAGPAGLWAGAWLGWAVAGLLLVAASPAPGVSYLFIVPALAASVCGLLFFGSRGVAGPAGTLAVLLALAVAAVLWFPILIPLYDGLGSGALLPIAGLLAIFLAPIAPLFLTAPSWLGRSLPIAVSVATVVLLGVGLTSPPYSKESPQLQNILLYEDADTGRTSWIVFARGPLAQSYRDAAAFSKQPQQVFPWNPQALAPTAPAPPLNAPAPQLTVLADTAAGGKRHLRLRLTSPRGADAATLIIPEAARLEAMTVAGTPVVLRGGKFTPFFGWHFQNIVGLPPEGLELEVVLGGTAPMDWYLFDGTRGLPPSGDALVKARPSTAVAVQEGDKTMVSRKVRI